MPDLGVINMRRGKALRDIAYGLPPMFGGWRMGDDLEKLATLPDGVLKINLLDGTAEHSLFPISRLRIAQELSGWMHSRLADYKIPPTRLSSANLVVHIRTDGVPTDKTRIVSFDMRIHSCLEFEGQKFERAIEKHVLHHRASRKPPTLAVRVRRAFITVLERLRFQRKERRFFSAAKRLRPGMTGEQIRALLGAPTTASELNSGKDTWVYRRGTYWGLGAGSAFYAEQLSLYLKVDNDKYVSQHLSRLVISEDPGAF